MEFYLMPYYEPINLPHCILLTENCHKTLMSLALKESLPSG